MKIFLALLFLALPLKADDVLRHFTKAVTTTATQVEAPGAQVSMMIIQNPSSNTASIFVGGDSGVTTSGATRGIEIPIGDSMSIEGSKHNGGTQFIQTGRFYVIAPSNQTVVVGVLQRN
jgi:hypothetical protein